MLDEVAAARIALEQSEGRHGPACTATWHWDLASGSVEWGEGLKALFGYAEIATDAAWRQNRIHPEDRDRVAVSLQRATIVNDGAVWSEQYRFRQADGSYATVTERAYVIHDDAGPRGVVGAITPTSAGRPTPRLHPPPVPRQRARRPRVSTWVKGPWPPRAG